LIFSFFARHGRRASWGAGLRNSFITIQFSFHCLGALPFAQRPVRISTFFSLPKKTERQRMSGKEKNVAKPKNGTPFAADTGCYRLGLGLVISRSRDTDVAALLFNS